MVLDGSFRSLLVGHHPSDKVHGSSQLLEESYQVNNIVYVCIR